MKADWERDWEFASYYHPYSLTELQNLTDSANSTNSHSHVIYPTVSPNTLEIISFV